MTCHVIMLGDASKKITYAMEQPMAILPYIRGLSEQWQCCLNTFYMVAHKPFKTLHSQLPLYTCFVMACDGVASS